MNATSTSAPQTATKPATVTSVAPAKTPVVTASPGSSPAPASATVQTQPQTQAPAAGTTSTATTTPTLSAGSPAPASATVQTVAVPTGTTTAEATVPQPTAPGQVVGVVLQNPTASQLAARYVTFGMTFADGQVPQGQSLIADIGGGTEPVQMDVKTRYADGSVRMAVLTLRQPQLAANASTGVMLSLGGAAGANTPLNISALTNPANYNVAVSLTGLTENTYNSASGATPSSTTPIPNVTVNVGQLLQQALSGSGGSSVSYWQQGPLATQVRIDTGQIAGTPLHLTFDITLYADGSTSTDVQFNNDIAMQASLGTQSTALNYNVAITQNGHSVLAQNNITQWQYQTWDQQVWSNGAPQVNIQHDIAALEKTGAIQNYDLSAGVNTSLIGSEASQLGGTTYGILGSAGITKYMGMTGGRPDIGPQTQWNTVWLVTQNASAAAYALAQADAAGSVPWHFYNPATGSYDTVTEYPKLWDSYSGGGNSGTQALTQTPAVPGWKGVSSTNSGWTPDAAHQPDLNYIAYLMTGNRYYLDQLNAQAAYSEFYNWPTTRLDAQGIVANDQVRQQAWSLREIVEAAAANPAGSAMQQYFSQMAANNIQYMLAESKTMGAGAVSGWFPGANGSNIGIMSPWQQDFLATTLGLAAGLGITGAKELLAWQTNFLAGLFLNGSNGFSPTDGADYHLTLYSATSGTLPGGLPGTPFTTWAQVDAASAAAGELGSGTLFADKDDQQLAKAALAQSITWTGSPEAMQAYGWLAANASLATLPYYQQDPTFDIVPRLSDGNLLTNSQQFIRNDTGSTPVTVQEGNGDQLVYERGSAPVTIIGGTGINVLFGGSGATTLIGGPQSDLLFGGAGATTFDGGSGNDYMQAGSGAALFNLSPADVGNDIVAGFRIGTDHLHIAGEAPGSAALATLIAGATQDGSNAVLHLSASHSVTIEGIGTSQLSTGLFS